MYAYTHVRTVTIEAASGSGGSVGVSISVSGPRGQHKMGPAKRRGVAWRGLAWCGVPAVPCRAARYVVYIRRSCFVAIRSSYAFVRVVYIYRRVPRVYGAERRGSRLEEMGLRDRPRVENRNII